VAGGEFAHVPRERRTHSIPHPLSPKQQPKRLLDDMVTTAAGRREMCRINFANIIPHTIQALLIECWLRVLSILEMLYPLTLLSSLYSVMLIAAAGFRLK
jgi:hypothetical protein